MKKTLVLAEKPSVGRDIAAVLKCNQNKNGFLEGKDFVVTWALGHLVTLADPEVYDKRYSAWNIEDLPILPKHLKLVVIKNTGKQFNTVKSQMIRDDIKDIVIATDAGREGELVARWIIEKAGVKKPLKRLWISSVTDKAIREGFSKLRDAREYENLYKAATARAEADWYVGINATRALTCKYNAQLSAGRVQTPTLKMIEEREREIEGFVSSEYYGIEAKINDIKFTWQDQKKNTRVFDESAVDMTIKRISKKSALVLNVEKENKKTNPPKLYDLTELQRDANKFYNFSAKETLSLMQTLYERHKILTYPRTDSRYLTSDLVDTLKDRLKAIGIGRYGRLSKKVLRSEIKPSKSFVDDSKVSDHHAIIPTEQTVFLDELSDGEKKIYDLVVKRFLSVLLPPLEYEQTTIVVEIDKETLVARGRVIKEMGWKEVYEGEADKDELEDIENESLSDINLRGELRVEEVSKTRGKTRPPKRFTEGTLLSAMENPIRYIDSKDKSLRDTLGKAGGIGTVATRADIIEKLFSSFLIEKRDKEITITSKGKQLLELVPEDLKSPRLTAEWEEKLDLISKGKLRCEDFISEMKDYARSLVLEIKKSESTFKHDNITKNKCPECGKYMLEVSGKRGKMLVCKDKECGYRKGISKTTNARCPNCKKKMELRGQGEGQIFACKCGYREKLSSFNKRKKESSNKLSKREVNKYLKNQNKEEDTPINSALKDALSKLKL